MRPLIIAHRGASHLAPENTLTAFRLAKTLGADGFECDVQITRDRHLVVAHDYLTDLKTGVHGNIPDMDFDDLRQLDFGKWKSPEFAGEKIPTLEEVLEVAQDFRMIHIELKPYLDRDEEIVDRIIDAVLDAGLEEKAVLTSFEYGALRRVKERMPQMATCAMTLSPESQLSQPATFWEKLGLKKTDPLVEKLSSPQALSEAAALLELLVTEQILTPTLREMIRQNLINCKTGADRLPKPLSGTGAVIGHKTGTSDRDERGIFAGTNDPGFVILPDGTRYTIAVFIKDSAENPETNARIIADISETVYRYVHDEYRENDIRPGKKHVDQGAGIGFESDYFY